MINYLSHNEIRKETEHAKGLQMECFWCGRYSECAASGVFSCPSASDAEDIQQEEKGE